MRKERARKKRIKILCLFAVFAVFVFSFFALFNILRSSYNQINEKLVEKEQLTLKYKELVDEQDALEKEVVRLQDPEYVGRYVREKYMYSKDGELILRISE